MTKKPTKKKLCKKIKFSKGVTTICFPTLGRDSIEEIRRVEKEYSLPKYSAIGFRYVKYVDVEFEVCEVFIQK